MKLLQSTAKIHPSAIITRVLCALVFLTLPFTLQAQSYDGLNHLEGYQITTYYSDGASEQAKIMAERCDKVLAFYNKYIDFEPTVTLLVLSPQDWSNYTDFPVYGMAHYDGDSTLIVASEDNDFWKSFLPPVERLPGGLAQQIIKTYSGENDELTMRPFFDLLVIHELGHAYHLQGGLIMQRRWMGELFANILLHTYIAENEPELLPALTIFPKMVVASTHKTMLTFTTLTELETRYTEIGQRYPNNYGWYQCRWHIAAEEIYNNGELDAFENLWLALKAQREILDDPSFAALLAEQVHQSVADVPLKWDDR